jgi:hypothetical protein
VDAVPARFYDLDDLLDSDLPAIIYFLGATRPETAMNDGKNYRAKKFDISRVERAVYKDAEMIFVCAFTSFYAPHSTCRWPGESWLSKYCLDLLPGARFRPP